MPFPKEHQDTLEEAYEKSERVVCLYGAPAMVKVTECFGGDSAL